MSINNDSREYTFTAEDGSEKTLKYKLLPAKAGLPLATKLSAIIIPALEEGFSITALIGTIADKIDIFELAQTLFKEATIDRGDGNDFPLNVSVYFAGNYGELIDCIADALEKNFASFFKAKAITSMSKLQQAI
ncbi:phage tail assembly chaperone [Enterobacter mori]